MDVKFRKLISRLSIKERMRPEKNMTSAGPESQIIIATNNSQEVTNSTQIEIENNNNNTDSGNKRTVLIPHPIDYWPESNILTQLQFPCPTLLRKNKCSSAMSEESFYEELKPRPRPTTPEVVLTTTEVPESSPEVVTETEDDINGQNDDNGNDNENVYINLQELEQERRRLIAAQCVRTKYAENWIDDQVVEDSIVGNNRAKTKIYWEQQMRKEQSEKSSWPHHKHSNNNAPSSDLIIQKMNAEIEELHRREKELKKKKVDLDDDEDVFSSNTSSVDEFENSDNPRLESGFYSNVGEDESIPSPELLKDALDTSASDNRSLSDSPLTVETENATFSPEKEVHIQSNSPVHLNNGDVGNELESPPVFTFQKETPIEREIRLAHERDNEYKMRRISSSTSNLTDQSLSLPATPMAAVTKDVKQPKPRSFSTSTTTVNEEKAPVTNGKAYNSRDIQYRMATERLKKEIQEAKQREEELKSRELSPAPATPTTPKAYVPVYVEPVQAVANRYEALEKRKSILSAKLSIDNDSTDNQVIIPERKNSIKLEERIQSHVEVVVAPVVNGSVATSNGPVSPSSPGTKVSDKSEVIYTPIARPKFNSIERYLLKSSVKLRIGKNFQIPTAASVFETDPAAVSEDKSEESAAAEEVEEPVTPRRKLIRAQDKIDQELREMREREKEFALRRAFKSTPDLTQSENNDTEEENNNATPAVVVVRKNEVVLDGKERRRSALIHQWEEKIQGGN